MGAFKGPFSLIGGFELSMGIVVLLPALGHEQALAQPTEGSDARLSLSHVPRRPAPSLVPDEPSNGAALQVGLVVSAQHPKRHAIGEVLRRRLELVAVPRVECLDRGTLIEDVTKATLSLVASIVIGLVKPQGGAGQVGDDVAKPHLTNGGLGGLNRSQDRDDANLWINQRFKRFLEPG